MSSIEGGVERSRGLTEGLVCENLGDASVSGAKPKIKTDSRYRIIIDNSDMVFFFFDLIPIASPLRRYMLVEIMHIYANYFLLNPEKITKKRDIEE
jgi:hypothetical protein